MEKAKKPRWGLVVCFALACAALLYAYCGLRAIPDRLQYVWPAPAQVAAADDSGTTSNAGLADTRGLMEAFRTATSGALEGTTLYAISDGCTLAPVSEDGESAVCRLEAVNDDYFALHAFTLLTGRLPYPDELKTGERVVLLDERLAVALFRYAEPTGRRVTLGTETYRVVGIVKRDKQVGDHQEYSAWISYRAAEVSDLSLSALCVESAPVPGSGALAAFQSSITALGGGGTVISLPKQKMNAALPLRLLLCVLGGAIGLLWIGRMVRTTRAAIKGVRARLRNEYFAHFWWRSVLRGLLLVLGFAAGIAALALVFWQLIEPVYTFPEWVPAVLVEPKDIAAAFWNVWQPGATVAEYRSPEWLHVQFYQTILAWSAGACALFGGALFMRTLGWLRERLPNKEAEL